MAPTLNCCMFYTPGTSKHGPCKNPQVLQAGQVLALGPTDLRDHGPDMFAERRTQVEITQPNGRLGPIFDMSSICPGNTLGQLLFHGQLASRSPIQVASDTAAILQVNRQGNTTLTCEPLVIVYIAAIRCITRRNGEPQWRTDFIHGETHRTWPQDHEPAFEQGQWVRVRLPDRGLPVPY